jgi:serine/threonine protein kinase
VIYTNRAPEIMLSFGRYTAVVDVWAAGCIFAEMQLGEPLFKAKSVPHQLESIVQVLGSLTEYDLRHIQKRREQDFMRVSATAANCLVV